MKDGFVRVAAATTAIRPADCAYNAELVLRQIRQAPEGTSVLVFPELCLTGSTCGDLFRQPTLCRAAELALQHLLRQTADSPLIFVVGMPVTVGSVLYSCAAVCQSGLVLGLVPGRVLPGGQPRGFGPRQNAVVFFAGQQVPFGRLLFTCRSLPALRLGVAIGEDLWEPGLALLTGAGATVIAAPYAEAECVTHPAFRRTMVQVRSARRRCTCVCAGAGEGESCSDGVFAGRNMIFENGVLLAESQPYTTGLICSETDVERLAYEQRQRPAGPAGPEVQTVPFDLPLVPLTLTRTFAPLPFVPEDPQERQARCEEVLRIQAAGLASRLTHTGAGAVLGLSGGLDSALALLVTVRAYQTLGRDPAGILAVTMPCFGTTDRTRNNACALAEVVGAGLRTFSIKAAVQQHLADIGHDGTPDTAYENAQARERTQVLMDLANRHGGLVVGTGDLSELALGWATFNGDHMSMYGVNAGVPKTLVRHLVAYEAQRLGGEAGRVLRDILDTPVSPELLPPQDGHIAQKTEQLVGPYELHDFFLYYTVRFGYPPHKVLRLAEQAFAGAFEKEEIRQWLRTFLRRFFAQQFKRNCLPDGPGVGSVSLSPRGAWHMPADASAAAWLQDAEPQ